MEIKTLFCSCVYFSVIVSAEKDPITFNDFLHRTFSPEIFNGSWISSNEYIYEDEVSVIKYNVDTDQSDTLLNKTVIDNYKMQHVTVSADGKWVALEHDKKTIFRHSTTSLYTLIHLDSGKAYPLADGKRVQLLVWAPVGSGLAFVVENNIFYQSEGDRVSGKHRQITNSSKDIYNGVADWVYEEEVLEDTKTVWFSPQGTKLVFATLNDSEVRSFTFQKYGDPSSLSSQYVQAISIKYPKVGTRNPEANVNYIDLQSDNLTPVIIKAPKDLVTSDNILGPVSWADDSHFSLTWLNRLQTKAYTLVCGVDEPAECKVVHAYDEKKGWLSIQKPVWINSSTFLTILPQDQGQEYGNYRQLSLVTESKAVALTSGLNVVTSIDCYDKQNNIVYYTSTLPGDSAKRHVYKMDLRNPENAECFSCRVNSECAYGTAYFSRTCANSVLTCKGPSVPEFHVYNKEGHLLRYLSNNSELAELLTHVLLASKWDLSVPVEDGFTARVRLLLPPNFDQTGSTKYPVLFRVYSGPDSNRISDMWTTPMWDEYVASRRNVIMVSLDGRGCGLRGDKIKFTIYHKFGGPEIDDILSVAKYLQNKYPFVDPLRFGIWGWSYGGFATAMTLARDSENVFRCGISVAPVTNWIYYDTVYTERYMGLPTEDSNLAGYLDSSVSANVSNFRSKLFYLIHGNADDNVHYQQSMMLSRALELADIMFFQQSYPDEDHGLVHVWRHLYHSMDRFWTRCFHLNTSEDKDHESLSQEQYSEY